MATVTWHYAGWLGWLAGQLMEIVESQNELLLPRLPTREASASNLKAVGLLRTRISVNPTRERRL